MDAVLGAGLIFDPTLVNGKSVGYRNGPDSQLPELTSSFNLSWTVNSADLLATPAPAVGFDDIKLNFGEFVHTFLGDVLNPVEKLIAPITNILDKLKTALPLISTISEALSFLGGGNVYDIITNHNSTIDDFLNAVGDLTNLVDLVNNAGADDYSIDLGSLDFGDKDLRLARGGGPNALANDGQDALGQLNSPGAIANEIADPVIKQYLGSSSPKDGLSLPILQDPSSIVGMLFGRNANLVAFDLTPIDATFNLASFPIPLFAPPPIFADLDFSVDLEAHLHFGYDTYGIAQFAQDHNSADLQRGFYIDSTKGPALGFTLNMGFGPEVDVGFVSAKIEAQFGANVSLNIADPLHLGKVRADDFGPQSFVGSGKFTVGLNLILSFGIEIPPLHIGVDTTIVLVPPQTILDFESQPDIEPATLEPDGTLLLNIGPRADQSGVSQAGAFGDIIYEISQGQKGNGSVDVSAFGVTKTYGDKDHPVTRIVGVVGDTDTSIRVVSSSDGTPKRLDGTPITFDLTGGPGTNYLMGGDGDDILRGGPGSTTIIGGNGNDTIYGNDENSQGIAGIQEKYLDFDGIEISNGLPAKTIIVGGPGNDVIFGGAKPTTIYGGSGNATIFAGSGNSVIFGGSGSNTIYSGPGNNVIVGGGGPNLIYGATAGSYTNLPPWMATEATLLYGPPEQSRSTGQNLIIAGTLDDALAALNSSSIPASDARLVGLAQHIPELVAILNKLSGGTATGTGTGKNTIVTEGGNDVVLAGPRGDAITVGTPANGIGGNLVIGGAGDDTIFGGNGHDTIDGGAGNDHIYGGDGGSVLYAGPGNDVVIGGAGNDTIYGGAGTDLLDGGAGDDTIYGGIGQATIYGGAGNDLIYGGTGDQVIDGGDGNNTIYAGTGDQLIRVGSGNNYLYGGTGDDTIYGGTGTDFIQGGTGNDILVGGPNGHATIHGGQGNDTIIASGGYGNFLYGGIGNDTIYGSPDAGSGPVDFFNGTPQGDIISGDRRRHDLRWRRTERHFRQLQQCHHRGGRRRQSDLWRHRQRYDHRRQRGRYDLWRHRSRHHQERRGQRLHICRQQRPAAGASAKRRCGDRRLGAARACDRHNRWRLRHFAHLRREWRQPDLWRFRSGDDRHRHRRQHHPWRQRQRRQHHGRRRQQYHHRVRRRLQHDQRRQRQRSHRAARRAQRRLWRLRQGCGCRRKRK
jgi:Ca2+-binding RTX toxin-like protein